MKNAKWVFISILTCFLLLVSCDNDNNSFFSNPNISDDTTHTGEDTTYNFAYEDSILFNSTRVLHTTNVQIGSINGTGIRILCDSLASYDAAWSPNKRKVIFIGTPRYGNYKDWGLYQIEFKNYKISRLVPQEKSVITAAFSPDLKYIAYSVYDETLGKKIKLYNNKNGDIIEVTEWITYEINVLSWEPDSKKILIDNGYLINIENKNISRLFDYGGHQIFKPNWSPDGSKVSFCGSINGGTNINIYNLNTQETYILFRQDTLFQFSSSWSKDGRQLIIDQRPFGSGKNSYLCKINIDGSNFVQITDGTENNSGPCWYK